MTKIVIPDDITIFHSEAKRLREERDALKDKLTEVALRHLSAESQAADNWRQVLELREERDKALEVNAEQANQITYWRDRAHHAEDQLRRAQQDRVRLTRSGE